ncbi:MAG: type I-U CRISPR-associated protein Csx17 [Chloroflexi bacterium]|nr:type I-U CRISPR-associated protein Csx17 [Chloroflexota bacterium]
MADAWYRGELALTGCGPETLQAYLKALGVFRLIAEQREPGVRACWRHDMFVLLAAGGREDLEGYFLEEYRPTPIVAPWNGGSGFGQKDNQQAMQAILASDGERLERYRHVIQQTRDLLASLTASAETNAKPLLLSRCRNTLSDDVLPWLDAAYVLSSDGPKYPPLLGTGGNDGRLEFSNNFMQNLVSCLGIAAGTAGGRQRADGGPDRRAWLTAALFGEDARGLIRGRTAGQFSPGSVGGPNATAGFEAGALTNPWDYVLMIEGALVFAGAVARRLAAESRSKAIFPFTVDTSAAGYGTAVSSEYGQSSRAELWLPLWDQPATYREIQHVFAEGRAQLGGRQAATGTDFARAAAGLGVERGILEFARFGLLLRNGRAFLAAPLGRFPVTSNPGVDVLFDLDQWLESLRRAARENSAPEALRRHVRQVDVAIMDLCQARDQRNNQELARKLQELLVALGRAELWLAEAPGRERIPPLSSLRPDWLRQTDDGSPEFRIAAALASIQGTEDGAVGPLRGHLEPVRLSGGRWRWAASNPSMVWQSGNLLHSMAAILQRRLLEATIEGGGANGSLPLRARLRNSLSDIVAFLDGRVDERRVEALIPALTAVDWQAVRPDFTFTGGADPGGSKPSPAGSTLVPASYATFKLLFLPWKLRREPGAPELEVRPDPSIVQLLRAGRGGDAYSTAWRRLYSRGLTPLVRATTIPKRFSTRLAAALLIPVRYAETFQLMAMALHSADDDA